MNKHIINGTDSDLVKVLFFGSSKHEYHIYSETLNFQLIFLLRLKDSSINYFDYLSMTMAQICKLNFNYYYYYFFFFFSF